jgi:hypothetical protein
MGELEVGLIILNGVTFDRLDLELIEFCLNGE